MWRTWSTLLQSRYCIHRRHSDRRKMVFGNLPMQNFPVLCNYWQWATTKIPLQDCVTVTNERLCGYNTTLAQFYFQLHLLVRNSKIKSGVNPLLWFGYSVRRKARERKLMRKIIRLWESHELNMSPKYKETVHFNCHHWHSHSLNMIRELHVCGLKIVLLTVSYC
jgi:hypothetical protein